MDRGEGGSCLVLVGMAFFDMNEPKAVFGTAGSSPKPFPPSRLARLAFFAGADFRLGDMEQSSVRTRLVPYDAE